MSTKHWTCPYCNRDCTITENDNKFLFSQVKNISADIGYYETTTEVITCPNEECRQQSIQLWINKVDFNGNLIHSVYHFELVPESQAKPFPEYIPKVILDDYYEACLIKTKSPKASATLSRRCLQGMIRDRWSISENTLYIEIQKLKDLIDPIIWQAIDSIREVGNIGAHMQSDVNIIIDVEPEEAGLLISLIEELLTEWYVNRHNKEEQMKKIIELSNAKKELKNQTSNTQ